MQKLMKQLGNGRMPNIGGLRGHARASGGAPRLVIALTVFIGLVGATVVAGYLTIFAAGTDRAARAVPADAIAYATVYLQPSTGQKMNLASARPRARLRVTRRTWTRRSTRSPLAAGPGWHRLRGRWPWIGNQLLSRAATRPAICRRRPRC